MIVRRETLDQLMANDVGWPLAAPEHSAVAGMVAG